MQIVIEISEESYKKLTQKSMLMSASAIDEAVDAIKHGKVCKGWIPVSERLPEIDGEYLVTYEKYFTPDHVDDINHKKSIGILCYLNKYGWFHDGVYAWMPLPDPYKAEKGEIK